MKTATKSATKTAAKVAVIGGGESIQEKLDHLKNVIGIERNQRIFSKSVSQDVRLLRFLNAEFKTPPIFRDDKFKQFVNNCNANGGLMNIEVKKAALKNIIDAKVDEEVARKVEEFAALPLSEAQATKLEAATSLYKEYLTSIVAKSKAMESMIK